MLELLDHKVHKVLLGLRDQKVKLVQLDHKVQPDLLAQVAEVLDLLDQKVTPVQLVHKVLREIRAVLLQFNL